MVATSCVVRERLVWLNTVTIRCSFVQLVAAMYWPVLAYTGTQLFSLFIPVSSCSIFSVSTVKLSVMCIILSFLFPALYLLLYCHVRVPSSIIFRNKLCFLKHCSIRLSGRIVVSSRHRKSGKTSTRRNTVLLHNVSPFSCQFCAVSYSFPSVFEQVSVIHPSVNGGYSLKYLMLEDSWFYWEPIITMYFRHLKKCKILCCTLSLLEHYWKINILTRINNRMLNILIKCDCVLSWVSWITSHVLISNLRYVILYFPTRHELRLAESNDEQFQ